jgi:AcrR family transcriptional regulator
MARWQANPADRLARAALELYAEKGFEETTVAEVAAAAGLTERTFYRHFADKREVLFGGAPMLEEVITMAVIDAPPDLSALASVAFGLEASTALFDGRRAFAEMRQRVILANPELQEREVAKMARLAGAIRLALHSRGVTEPTATLAAQSGVAVYSIAFQTWLLDTGAEFLPTLRATLAHFRSVVSDQPLTA